MTTTENQTNETRKRRTWPWITGIVAAWLIGIAIGAAGGGDTEPAAQHAPEPEVETIEIEVDSPELLDRLAELEEQLAEAEAAAEEQTEAEEAEAEPEPAEEEPTTEFTAEEENAIGAARDYLRVMSFSRSGLISQLEFEGYSTESAALAVDYLDPDWNAQAAASAQDYLDTMSFSRSGLISQLEYEGFTTEQATFGVDQAGL